MQIACTCHLAVKMFYLYTNIIHCVGTTVGNKNSIRRGSVVLIFGNTAFFNNSDLLVCNVSPSTQLMHQTIYVSDILLLHSRIDECFRQISLISELSEDPSIDSEQPHPTWE